MRRIRRLRFFAEKSLGTSTRVLAEQSDTCADG